MRYFLKRQTISTTTTNKQAEILELKKSMDKKNCHGEHLQLAFTWNGYPYTFTAEAPRFLKQG